ncbi:unnamed protein product, partial [Ectocarpus fasciculatus]
GLKRWEVISIGWIYYGRHILGHPRPSGKERLAIGDRSCGNKSAAVLLLLPIPRSLRPRYNTEDNYNSNTLALGLLPMLIAPQACALPPPPHHHRLPITNTHDRVSNNNTGNIKRSPRPRQPN